MPDVNGLWSGEYRYAVLPIVVQFTATLRQSGITVVGTTLEENKLVETGPPELTAELLGEHSGTLISFTKIYLPETRIQQPPVIYQGETDADCARITGSWNFGEFHRQVHGTFFMNRVSDRAGRSAASRRRKLPTEE